MRPVADRPLDFTLDDENGRAWRLSEHLGDSVVLLFLRGDW
jgi:peroxiredoxin